MTGRDVSVKLISAENSDPPPVTHRFIIECREEAKGLYLPHWALPGNGDAPDGTGKDKNYNYDSGVDLPLPREVTFPPQEVTEVGLGIRAVCIAIYWTNPHFPWGVRSPFYLLPRSSISKPDSHVLLMPNSPGLIDMNYRGELKVRLFNPTTEAITFPRGKALVQLAVPSLNAPEYVSYPAGSEELKNLFGGADRGGGFGSTGDRGTGGLPPAATPRTSETCAPPDDVKAALPDGGEISPPDGGKASATPQA